jgi:hypothetical protein
MFASGPKKTTTTHSMQIRRHLDQCWLLPSATLKRTPSSLHFETWVLNVLATEPWVCKKPLPVNSCTNGHLHFLLCTVHRNRAHFALFHGTSRTKGMRKSWTDSLCKCVNPPIGLQCLHIHFRIWSYRGCGYEGLYLLVYKSRVVCWKLTDVSEEHVSPFIRIEEEAKEEMSMNLTLLDYF